MTLPGGPRLLVVLTGLLLLTAGGLAVLAQRVNARQPIEIVLPAPAAEADMRVYVSGAVVAPGVYTLGPNDRIEDALRAAGGPTAEADLDRVNLAARLHDGDQVDVPAKAAPGVTPALAVKVNLNTATEADLDRLPGIGAVRARRIIESRLQDGAFQDAFELVERRILTPALYQRLRDQVTVR
jgi:competence protein ComEA